MDIIEKLLDSEYVLAADEFKDAADEIHILRLEIEQQRAKTKAAFDREAGWIKNISKAKDQIDRLENALNQIVEEMEYQPGNGDVALRIAKQALGLIDG